MTNDLNDRLAAWVAPAPSDASRLRLDELLTESQLPGPLAATRSTTRLLPLAYAMAVGLILLVTLVPLPAPLPALTQHDLAAIGPLVVTPGLPEASQTSATAVSAVDLHGFQLIEHPRIHVKRSTP